MHKNDNSFSKSKALLFKLELLKLEIESLKNKVISDEKEDALDNVFKIECAAFDIKKSINVSLRSSYERSKG